jgi:hypothetical protein
MLLQVLSRQTGRSLYNTHPRDAEIDQIVLLNAERLLMTWVTFQSKYKNKMAGHETSHCNNAGYQLQ